MFPKNCWYVAAISTEIAPGAILSRTVCETPLALFRSHEGEVSVLLDRCPHRLYPLSAGTVTERGLQCGYHGLTFAGSGRCVDIPSQPEIPANACVRSFPVRESHGFVWIWPGEPAIAQATPLPAFPTGEGYLQGLDFSCVTDTANWGVAGPELIQIDANYMLAVDNLLDLTHTAFVHKDTFDNGAVLSSERSVKAVGDHVFDFFAIQGQLSKVLQNAYLMGDELQDNFLETYWAPPGIMILVHGATPRGEDRHKGAIVLNVNIVTPATATSCHYFWVQSVWQNKGDGVVRDNWDRMTRVAFAEDEATLSNQQANLTRFGVGDVSEDIGLVLKADKAIVLARRIVAKKLRDEQLEQAA
jgi:vanillate monooxygenase